jgi:hypothetical protein
MAVFTGSGSAASPSITFSADTNTGIFSPGADQVSITTNGAERLRVNAAGQVGSVSLGTAAAPAYSFTGDLDTGLWSPAANTFAVSTGGAERARITSANDLLIGGTLPASPNLELRNSGVIVSRGGGTPPAVPTGARVSITNGAYRLQSSGFGVGAWNTAGFTLDIGASATDIMRIGTSLANLFDGRIAAAGYMTIGCRWPGAANNGNRIRLYSFRFLQSGRVITELEGSIAGSASDWTLSTSTSSGSVQIQLANNSGFFNMQGHMSILLLGGSEISYSVSALI